MRKFLPRFFMVISFILCLFLILPFESLSTMFESFGTETWVKIARTPHYWEWIKYFYIPAFCALVGLIYFITAMVDRARHNKRCSIPIKNAIYAPMAFYISGSLLYGIYTLAFHFGKTNYPAGIHDADFFSLGWFINHNLPQVAAVFDKQWISIVYYVVVLVLFILMLLTLKNLHKKNFFVKGLVGLGFLVVAVLASKGMVDAFHVGTASEYIGYLDLRTCAGLGEKPIFTLLKQFHTNDYFKYDGFKSGAFLIQLGVAGLALILFIIIASVRAHKVNKIEKKVRLIGSEEAQADTLIEEFVPRVGELPQDQNPLDEGLFVLPQPEDVLETEVEEKTVIKTLVYEASDLNERYTIDFGFKNTAMVKREGYTDYFVNKQKFLTLSNSNKQMSFRLELDKAIKLIIQYPLVGKDKYENHKIWFKIDDTSILNKDVVVSIIKDAYDTVLNNL